LIALIGFLTDPEMLNLSGWWTQARHSFDDWLFCKIAKARGFFVECGSRLTVGENREGTTDFVGINAGSLDDPSWFHPQFDIFTSDARP
jgi:hypothetical protein